MAWTAPRTWVTSEIVTAAQLNAHVRDNLRYLKGLDGDTTFSDDIVVTAGGSLLKVSADNSWTSIHGGNSVVCGRVDVYGKDAAAHPGDVWLRVVNAAKNGTIDALKIIGCTDIPAVTWDTAAVHTNLKLGGAQDANSQQINNLPAPAAANDAARKAYVDDKGPVEIFIPCTYATSGIMALSEYPVGNVDANGENALTAFRIPSDFTTITTAVLVCLCTAAMEVVAACDIRFAAAGEAYNTHFDSCVITFTYVANQWKAHDISTALTGIAANDYVGIEFEDTEPDAHEVYVLGVYLKYT